MNENVRPGDWALYDRIWFEMFPGLALRGFVDHVGRHFLRIRVDDAGLWRSWLVRKRSCFLFRRVPTDNGLPVHGLPAYA